MGRSCRALPGRQSIVLSRQAGFEAEGCDVVETIEDAIAAAGDAEEVMIIGGGEIYRQFLPQVDRIYLTREQAEVDAMLTRQRAQLASQPLLVQSAGTWPALEAKVGAELVRQRVQPASQ